MFSKKTLLHTILQYFNLPVFLYLYSAKLFIHSQVVYYYPIAYFKFNLHSYTDTALWHCCCRCNVTSMLLYICACGKPVS